MDRIQLNNWENTSLIIDVGLTYTKVGFSKEAVPFQVIQTPLSTIQALHNSQEQLIYTYQVAQYYSTGIRENLSKINRASFAEAFRLEDDRLHKEVEEMLTNIFYHVLKTSPYDKKIVICERLGGMHKLIEAMVHVLFTKFKVKSVYNLLTNVLPLYATGLETGIVVDCGFQQVEILPFCMSQVCIEGFEICQAGGIEVEKTLSKMIRDDNQKTLTRLIPKIPQYKHDLPSKVIEDVKVRTLFTMQLPQKIDYLSLDEKDGVKAAQNVEKMKKKLTTFGKQHKEFPSLAVSFFTRAMAMEVCFGNHEEDEPNIAVSILRSVMKLGVDQRVLVIQNIILAGGTCMVPGFKLRVKQEMLHLIDTFKEFEDLKTLKEKIKFADSTFPPNCMAWAGASLISLLNTEIERFMTTHEEYEKANNVLEDRFGEAYLFATRDEPYLNPDFEYKNQYAKQSLYSSMSPYSARSYQERRKNINNQMERQSLLNNIRTPTGSQIGLPITPSSKAT